MFGLSRSAWGLILQATGQDRIEAAALGFNVTKHKLAAFCLSALFSGLAGAMLTFYEGTASVDQMVDLSIAVQIIIAVVFGGRRTILGGVLGAIFLVLFDELLRPIGQLNTFVVAAIALVVILFFPDGVLGYALRRREQRLMRNSATLEVRGLTKRFGGLVAVNDISFDVRPGEILGLIGPNGSGKSTVMKLVMGIERPNAGEVRLDGVDVAGWPTHRIARHGRGHRVPAFPSAASADSAGEHQAGAAAGFAVPPSGGSARGRARAGDRRAGRAGAMCIDRRPPPCRSPIFAGWRWRRRLPAIRKWC